MATNFKPGALTSFVDYIFTVGGEMIEQNGEDSYSFCLNNQLGYIGVFDGCGGIGSRKYDIYDNKTGAYIASHAAALTMLDWFKKFSELGILPTQQNTAQICDSIKENFERELKSYEPSLGGVAIKGSLAKSFPTTASVVLFSCAGNRLNATYIWAGDSRGYVLEETGLCQITQDDIEDSGDALENLSNDSKLTNMVCADGNFTLHSTFVNNVEKGIFITATDGFFAYFSTPMEFEFMLTDTLLASESVEQWKNALDEYIKNYTADDYTIGMAVCGYKSFKSLKKAFLNRHRELYEKYISKLESLDEEQKIKLWNEYKTNYYRGD